MAIAGKKTENDRDFRETQGSATGFRREPERIRNHKQHPMKKRSERAKYIYYRFRTLPVWKMPRIKR